MGDRGVAPGDPARLMNRIVRTAGPSKTPTAHSNQPCILIIDRSICKVNQSASGELLRQSAQSLAGRVSFVEFTPLLAEEVVSDLLGLQRSPHAVRLRRDHANACTRHPYPIKDRWLGQPRLSRLPQSPRHPGREPARCGLRQPVKPRAPGRWWHCRWQDG